MAVVYHWKHGWIPLDHAAALSKAHGSHKGAQRYMTHVSEAHLPRDAHVMAGVTHDGKVAIYDRRTGHSAAITADRAAHLHATGHRITGVNTPGRLQTKSTLTALSDNDLSMRLAAAADNPAALDAVLTELDRRDRAAHATRVRAEQRNAAHDAEFNQRVDAGEDPEQVYADIHGTTVTKMRRAQALSALRAEGHKGAGFHEAARAAYREETARLYTAAEAHTNGFMLNKAGQAAHVDPRSLFTGPESRARKYASDELLSFWQSHSRLTLDDYTAGLLGGKARSAGTAAWI